MAKTRDVKPCPGCGREIRTRAKACAACSGITSGAASPEGRDQHALCGAKARTTGKRCRKFAGEGTDHPGVGLCRFHGGLTPAHKTHAIALEAKQRMVKLGTPIEDVTPLDALFGLLRSSAGHVSWLRAEIAEMDDLGTHEAKVLLGMYDGERDRYARIAEAAVRSGATERMVELQEREAALWAGVIRLALRRAGFGHTDQRRVLTALDEVIEGSAAAVPSA
jgi:hypothetical protein